MKTIVLYIKAYFSVLDKRVLSLVTLFTGSLIAVNYHFGLDGMIRKNQFFIKLIDWWAVFALAFSFPGET